MSKRRREPNPGKMDWEVTVLEGKGIDKVFSVVFVVVFLPQEEDRNGAFGVALF